MKTRTVTENRALRFLAFAFYASALSLCGAAAYAPPDALGLPQRGRGPAAHGPAILRLGARKAENPRSEFEPQPERR